MKLKRYKVLKLVKKILENARIKIIVCGRVDYLNKVAEKRVTSLENLYALMGETYFIT